MHWTGSTAYLSHRKRTSKFEDRLRLFSLSNRRKSNEEKWTDPQRPVGHHQAYQHKHNESRKRRAESIIEEIRVKNFPNLMKILNIYESQQTSAMVISKKCIARHIINYWKTRILKAIIKKWLITYKVIFSKKD